MEMNFNEFAGGELAQKLNIALQKVQENLLDLNTPFKNKRQISVKIGFTQNEARDNLEIEVSVDTKLASVAPTKTHAYIEKDLKTGKIFMEEYGSQIRGQMSLNDIQTAEPEQPECPADCDPETGEIINPTPQNNRVVPIQRVAGE